MSFSGLWKNHCTVHLYNDFRWPNDAPVFKKHSAFCLGPCSKAKTSDVNVCNDVVLHICWASSPPFSYTRLDDGTGRSFYASTQHQSQRACRTSHFLPWSTSTNTSQLHRGCRPRRKQTWITPKTRLWEWVRYRIISSPSPELAGRLPSLQLADSSFGHIH